MKSIKEELTSFQDRLTSRAKESKTVWHMTMVRRDHLQRYNPYAELLPIYDVVMSKLEGYIYEVSEIEKAFEETKHCGPTYEVFYRLQELGDRLSALPKPDDFLYRTAAVARPPQSFIGVARI